MRELSRSSYIVIISFITCLMFLGCNEDGVEEPVVSIINPKIDSLIEDFTQYLLKSPPLYKGEKTISLWIQQNKENEYIIIVDNNIPAECEKRVGVLYKNGFKIYVLITTDTEKQKIVHIENMYSEKSKKKCQKWVDRYLANVNKSFFIDDKRVEEGIFNFINDTLYFSATSYLYEGFKSNISKD